MELRTENELTVILFFQVWSIFLFVLHFYGFDEIDVVNNEKGVLNTL